MINSVKSYINMKSNILKIGAYFITYIYIVIKYIYIVYIHISYTFYYIFFKSKNFVFFLNS